MSGPPPFFPPDSTLPPCSPLDSLDELKLSPPILTLWPLLLCAQNAGPNYYSVPPVDAPELAPRGAYGVGVRTLDLVDPGQVDILNFADAAHPALYDRPLPVEVWYPATIPPGTEERTVYQAPLSVPSGAPPRTFELPGKALRDAPPVAGQRFPLVVVSHGFPGYGTFLSYLTENLASKGYVVASIDHTDSVVGAVKGFQSTLLNRAKDQLFVMNRLRALSAESDGFLSGLLDPDKVAIVGYSMGGYGALATAGAGYSREGSAFRIVPGEQLAPLTHGDPRFEAIDRGPIKAVVAISPWGEQAPHSSWSDEALAEITKPTLFIVGDQDDVSGYEDGVRKLFEKETGADRYMLVYQNARHNIGGNPPPTQSLTGFTEREYYDEPVWRKDRITAINQHFITAFLDLNLKGDEAKRDYLNVATTSSNDGKWPLARGESAGDSFSPGLGKQGFNYWKGFHRRWAVGLELHHLTPGP